jgi:regulatory protein
VRRSKPDTDPAALDALERSGALADARFTDSFVRSRIAKGQGPQRIRAELAQRGIADDEADDGLRAADVDWLAAIRAVRAKRFGPELPRDYAERARQARFLQYRGFSAAHIRAALEFDGDSD